VIEMRTDLRPSASNENHRPPAIPFTNLANSGLGRQTPLAGVGAFMGRIFPMTYFLPISVGAFTKGLGFQDLAGNLLSLTIFGIVLILLSLAFLRGQEA
jgi:hypothetical protein